MGCIVNGPGESKHADIGISLPGTGETPAAPVFIDGAKAVTLRGRRIAAEFKALVDAYVDRRYGRGRGGGIACATRHFRIMRPPCTNRPLHRQDDLEAQHALIAASPLGLLITIGPQGLLANAIPFLIDAGARQIRHADGAHGARQRQWRDLPSGRRGAGRLPGPRALHLAVVVRDETRDRQGRADLELCDGPGARASSR